MSDGDTRSWIAVVHTIVGRTRLRSPLLRNDHDRGERVADGLVEVAGVREVNVRPYTGSVLVMHDSKLSAEQLAAHAGRVLGVDKVLAIGERPPLPKRVPPFSAVARKLVHAVHELDEDIRRKTDGTVDLGTLATLGFFGAGAAEVAVSGRLPLPPWFNLAWWGYNTFVTAEQDEIRAESNGDA